MKKIFTNEDRLGMKYAILGMKIIRTIIALCNFLETGNSI
jgi:hypothetical protein